MKLKPGFQIALKYLIGFGLLYFVFRMGSGYDFSILTPLFTFKFFAFILFCKIAALSLCVYRWKIIINSFGVFVPFRRLFSLSMVGVASSYVMPGALSGDLVKSAFLKKYVNDLRKISISVIFDRLFGLSSVGLLMSISIFILYKSHFSAVSKAFGLIQQNSLFWALGVFALVLSSLLVLYRINNKLYSKLREPLKEVALIKNKAALLLILSCLSQGILVFCYYVIYNTLGEESLGLAPITFVFCFASLAVVLPLTPGGVGVGQMVFNFVLGLFLMRASTIGATVFTVLQIFDLIFIIPGVAIVFLKMIKKNK